jgi:Flp pilus assembly protein TadD
MTDRIAALQKMLERNANDPRAHFGLAAELEKQADWAGVIRHLEAYLQLADDQGNAWGRLGHAHRQLGDMDRARSAYARGITAAQQHGHPSMAAEFEEVVDELDA